MLTDILAEFELKAPDVENAELPCFIKVTDAAIFEPALNTTPFVFIIDCPPMMILTAPRTSNTALPLKINLPQTLS